LLKGPELNQQDSFKLVEINKGQYYLHPIFEMAIEDVFNKFDMLMNKVLGYREFKGFCDCVGINNLTYQSFISDYL
tara:strand:- start:161 stop:388 length:228 start_codon:yes stop_codon:yes gene_type:complete